MIDTKNKIIPLLDFYTSLGYKPEQRNGIKEFYSFSSVKNEYDTIYNGVGLRDISNHALIILSGKDVLDFLHRITTNDVKDLYFQKTIRTIFTNEKGKILDSVQLINLKDEYLIIGSKGTEHKLTSWIKKYVIMDDVKVESAGEKYSVFEVLGPQANSFMTLLCGSQVDSLHENHVSSFSIDDSNFILLKRIDKNNHEIFWIISNHADGMKLINYSLQNKGVFEFHLIGNDAYELYRIEQHILSENELNDNVNPHEVKLLNEVSFKKGCYIGQEVVARLDTYDKVQKYITGVVFNEEISKDSSLILFDEMNNEVGKITSHAFSEYCGKSVGLAFVKKQFLKNGYRLICKQNSQKDFDVFIKDEPCRK